MNDSTDKPSDGFDPQDQLVDRLLAEAVGGETPPDQSEAILRRAEEMRVDAASISERREEKMKKRSFKFTLAELAVVVAFVGATIALLVPAVPRLTRKSTDVVALQDAEPKAGKPAPMTEEPLRYQDNEMASMDETADGTTVERGEGLVMGVTPKVIIQEQEENRLVVEAEPAAPSVVAGNEAKGTNHLARDLGTQKPATAAGAPFAPAEEQAESFAARGRQPSESPPPIVYPDAESLSDLTGSRKEYSAVQLGQSTTSSEYAFGVDALALSEMESSEPLGRVKRRGGDWRRPDRDRDDGRGVGPGRSGDQYSRIEENPFVAVKGQDALSTFSIDVDTASYANVRQFLMQSNRLPPPDAVRIEELVNYFGYDYQGPSEGDSAPFAAAMEVAGCPWAPTHRLVRVALKGREVERQARPMSNLVFLVDVSGSMNQPNKLPLVVSGLRKLTEELGENDRVAIVVYASSEGVALESTPGNEQRKIYEALDRLRAGGSTAGGAGIQLAYQIAEKNFIEEGVNRVILCTDGDFNVGVTSTAELERLVEKKAKESGVFLSVLGFGRGNLNDAMMETISNRGNGNYGYIDTERESHKVLVEQMSGTLVTIAKDVKIQVEFNPARVAGYRLLGYENRMLRAEDFNDDKKDAGEIGAGHTVTALYEIVPVGQPVGAGSVDPLKYQTHGEPEASAPGEVTNELLTLKLRYKQPDGDTSTKLEFTLEDPGQGFGAASRDFQFASAVVEFGMLLRGSQYKGSASYDAALEIAESNLGADPHGYRAEFLELVRKARALSGE